MALAGLFIHNRTIPAELLSLTIVTLLGRDEFDPAVPVPMVVQVYERSYPLTGLHCGSKGLERIISRYIAVLNSASEFGLSFETRGLEKDLRVQRQTALSR